MAIRSLLARKVKGIKRKGSTERKIETKPKSILGVSVLNLLQAEPKANRLESKTNYLHAAIANNSISIDASTTRSGKREIIIDSKDEINESPYSAYNQCIYGSLAKCQFQDEIDMPKCQFKVSVKRKVKNSRRYLSESQPHSAKRGLEDLNYTSPECINK